jgi:hypothetical protein
VTHVSQHTLALLAGGDLKGFAAWRAHRHVARCAGCRSALASFEAARAKLRDAAGELPPAVNWDRLASEMSANIHVGLEAAAVVTPRVAPSRLDWRAAVAFASLAAVIVTGWVMNVPRLTPQPIASVSSGGTTVELSPAGVEWKRGAQGIALLHPRSNRVSYSVGMGSAEARFVDVETDQVTITHVSLE